MEVLCWLKQRACLSWHSADMCAAAACGGHRAVLQWLRSEGHPWDSGCFVQAAARGHVAVLQWLQDNGCPSEPSERIGGLCMEKAAFQGHVKVLWWLQKQQCEWTGETLLAAGAGGHLGVVQWLLKEGCPGGERACLGAASVGHVHLLTWLRNIGLQADRHSVEEAAQLGVRWYTRTEGSALPHWLSAAHDGLGSQLRLYCGQHPLVGPQLVVLQWLAEGGECAPPWRKGAVM